MVGFDACTYSELRVPIFSTADVIGFAIAVIAVRLEDRKTGLPGISLSIGLIDARKLSLEIGQSISLLAFNGVLYLDLSSMAVFLLV